MEASKNVGLFLAAMRARREGPSPPSCITIWLSRRAFTVTRCLFVLMPGTGPRLRSSDPGADGRGDGPHQRDRGPDRGNPGLRGATRAGLGSGSGW